MKFKFYATQKGSTAETYLFEMQALPFILLAMETVLYCGDEYTVISHKLVVVGTPYMKYMVTKSNEI